MGPPDSAQTRSFKALRAFKVISFGFGAIALIYCAWVLIAAAAYQSHAHHALKALRDYYLTGSPSRALPKPAIGSPLADLSIPRIGLDVAVLEGTDAHTLRLGAGHEVGTRLPGEGGNVVIAGHRDTFFRPLRQVRAGDLIDLSSPSGTDRYQVVWTRVVQPDNTAALKPAGQAVLTLITCYPFGYIGPAPDRFVVRARHVQ